MEQNSNYQNSNYQNSNYQNSNYQNSNYQNSNYQNSNYQDSNYQDSNYQNSNYQDSNYQDSNYRNTNNQDSDVQSSVMHSTGGEKPKSKKWIIYAAFVVVIALIVAVSVIIGVSIAKDDTPTVQQPMGGVSVQSATGNQPTGSAPGKGDVITPSAPMDSKEPPAATTPPETTEPQAGRHPGVEDGVLTVGMDCGVMPFGWVQYNDSDGAVPIANKYNEFANGYDVMIAKKLCEANGWELEILRFDWDELIPAVQNGEVDAVISGQTRTGERMQEVAFTDPYGYMDLVCLVKDGSPLSSATGRSQLTGAGISLDLWWLAEEYEDQLVNVDSLTPVYSTSEAVDALDQGQADFVCTDLFTAVCAIETCEDLKLVRFAGSGNDFDLPEEGRTVHISVQKGQTALQTVLNSALAQLTEAEHMSLLTQAARIAPVGY